MGVDVSSKRRWDARDDVGGGAGDGDEADAETRERGRARRDAGGDAEETGGRDDESTELGDGDDDESGGVLIGDASRVESSRLRRLGRVFERRESVLLLVFMYSNSSFFHSSTNALPSSLAVFDARTITRRPRRR